MTNESEKSWTGNIHLGSKVDLEVVFKQLCKAFNSSPFFGHNSMTMRVVDGQIETYVEMKAEMIGNVAFQILHGGVAATVSTVLVALPLWVNCINVQIRTSRQIP